MTTKLTHSTVSSDEVNYLVFRHLQESGYVHSAFTFGFESQLNTSKIDGSQVPPGALLSFVQRGVHSAEIAESLLEDRKDGGGGTSAMDGVTSLLNVHRYLCNQGFKNGEQGNSSGPGNGTGPIGMDIDEKDTEGSGEKSGESSKSNIEIPASDTLTLRGHTSEVFICAWNPRASVLASGSGDSTARIWPIPTNFPAPSSAAAAAVMPATQPIVLKHPLQKPMRNVPTERKTNDVTALDWNPSGTLLATGTYDGCARVWTDTGELKHIMFMHKGPLFFLKWNKSGSYFLSGSVDCTTAVWNADTGRCVKQFPFHHGPALHVDWKDDETFASCSTDKMIYMCSLQSNYPVRTYEGHEDEVNCLKFDPSGNLLASCSDDYTAKIWSSNSRQMLHNLKEHTREVYTMQWCPQKHGRLILATAAFDALVKLWDVNAGRCIKTLAGHTDPIYSLAYSPDGQFLASGSFDRSLNIWSAKDGTLLKKFSGDGGIFDVAWNPPGDKVSACFSSNTVCVVDLRMLVSSPIKL